jgi:hypothetical protein
MSTRLARLRRRLSFANVTSLLALFLALGGTSYAAATIGAAQIRSGAVGASEIRSGAVGKSEIRTGAVGKSELATNSAGALELRSNSVGNAELADDAVATSELKNGSVELDDLSTAARTALTAIDRAAVSSTGTAAGGNAKAATRSATGAYTVEFPHDVSACTYSATPAAVKSGTTTEEPPAGGGITVAAGERNTNVVVKTFDKDGAAVDAPFHLIAAC